MTKKALVIGASGQVGTALMGVLGPGAAIGTSRRHRPGWVQCDLAALANNPQAASTLLRTNGGGVVYCVGASTNVDACEQDMPATMAVNCHGPATLARVAADLGLPFVYFSSDYVFDGVAGPYREDSPPNPLSVYGRSKLEGELAVSRAHPTALVIRTTGVYGPDPGGKNFLYTLRTALTKGSTLRVPSDQLFTPTFNHDLAAAAVRLAQERVAGMMHVCGPDHLSRLTFAIQLADALGLSSDHIVGVATADLGQRAMRPLRAGLATQKLAHALPTIRMRTVCESLSHWRDQPDHLDPPTRTAPGA